MFTAILLMAVSQLQYSDCANGQCPTAMPEQPSGNFYTTGPQGQPLIGSTQFKSTQPPKPNQIYGWHTRNRIRPEFNDPQLGTVLSDIEANMSAQHPYRANDRITWAHETTHGISSALRVELGGELNAFYVGKGYAMILREPKFKKSLVNRYVPQELRGELWSTYMDNTQVNGGATGAQHQGMVVEGWGDTPTYILDEYNAYIAGMECAAELKSKGLSLGDDGNPGVRAWTKDLDHAIEFSAYAHALQKAIADFDPQYPDKERLASFLKYNNSRIAKLVNTPGVGGPEQKALLARVDAWRGSPSTPQSNPQFVAKSAQEQGLTVEQRLDRIERQLTLILRASK